MFSRVLHNLNPACKRTTEGTHDLLGTFLSTRAKLSHFQARVTFLVLPCCALSAALPGGPNKVLARQSACFYLKHSTCAAAGLCTVRVPRACAVVARRHAGMMSPCVYVAGAVRVCFFVPGLLVFSVDVVLCGGGLIIRTVRVLFCLQLWRRRQLQELKHGRLATLAITGMQAG